ncbi:MAG: sugar ABC transporter ATP-binding protein [Lachnospiraceae bacterium]|nr:sugar ABC transporter ATP-binding protein [Lachnospiraceae bacterium]
MGTEEQGREPVLRVQNLSKTFYSTRALQGVSFELLPGEVHALMGENGAGKSTLGKCVTGIYRPEEGEIFYQGKQVSYGNPKEALDAGIAIVLQEFNVIPHLSVAENIFLTDREYYRQGWYSDYASMVHRTEELLNYFHMREFIDPMEPVSGLSVAEMQIVEIIKAMSRKARVIILDEPTATLSGKEVDRLFEMIRELKEKGVAFVIVSHRIQEIYQISDRITVFRDGKLVLAHAATRDLEEMDLIRAMVGRQIDDLYGKKNRRKSRGTREVLLEVQGISDRVNFVRDCSFQVYKGEILGIAGLVGAGRTELMRCVFGIDARSRGSVCFKGKEIKENSIPASIRAGMGYLSEKRKEEGLHQELSIISNLNMVVHAVAKRPWISAQKEERRCGELVERLRIKVGEPYNRVRSLSGGNQQKILLGKWLLANPELLIIDEPTRGIDVASKSEIYGILRELADAGLSIVMISSEIHEILGVTDRTLVVRDGKIVATLCTGETTEEEIGYYATVGTKEGAEG